MPNLAFSWDHTNTAISSTLRLTNRSDVYHGFNVGVAADRGNDG